ncbi:MAG: DinB family protein [Acidimicrobiia bacterium]|nr:DinB family protein [Acidimicrobiia bacterium]
MSSGPAVAADLRAAIEEGVALFAGTGEDITARRPSPGKWSAREVIGHLIDSACNNQRRFIINQGNVDRLIVDPYEQNEWVERSCYADTAGADLVATWTAYNRHIARVLEAIPDAALNRPLGPLADYRFSYMAPPATDYATLGYLAQDYVAHIRHHLKQIRALLG